MKGDKTLRIITLILSLASILSLAACTCGGQSTGSPRAGADKAEAVSKNLEAIGGKEWVLSHWDLDEATPGAPEVTLRFDDGSFAGRSGCNNYFAAVKKGPAPGDITIGPAGSTQMYCAGPAMAVEYRFLGNLNSIKAFSL